MLRLVSMIHAYPPYHNAGAETFVHQLHRWFKSRGHEVTVLQRDPIAGPEWDGIRTIRRGPPRWVDRTTRGKIILTHLDETPIAMAASERTGSPLIHLLHNDKQLDFHNVKRADLIVANSAWVRDLIPARLAHVPSLILYPPTFCADYPTGDTDREAITLVNMLAGKGAPLFYELARRLPDRLFYGVVGAYGQQVPPPHLPNLAMIRNRPDMSDVWAETRIYLQPSAYESFGKAAAEAMASAIPVIAHPTDGLVESLGPAGIFADRDDPEAWIEAIETLDDPKTYTAASKAARGRAEELETVTVAQLETLESALLELMPDA